MDKIVSYDQIQMFIKKIRSLNNGFITNFYWDDNKHPYWLESGTFSFEENHDCILMNKDQGEFINLFYIATGVGALEATLKNFTLQKTCSIDVVSKSEESEEVSLFNKLGYETYRFLYRMSHIGALPFKDLKNPNVFPASDDDLKTVRNMLLSHFDPLSEQIPSLYEMRQIGKKKGVLVYKEGNEVCGFTVFEDKGKTWYWRYWFVSDDHRNKGIGSAIFDASVRTSINSKRQILWVVDDNDNAIKRHIHYGFNAEKLYNTVLIKKI